MGGQYAGETVPARMSPEFVRIEQRATQMFCQHDSGVRGGNGMRGGKSRTPLFLAGACAFAAFVVNVASLPARAETERSSAAREAVAVRSARGGGGDENKVGNGARNANISAVKSPTNNHGYQHTSTSDIGGATSVQNVLCRNVKVCSVTQKITAVIPEQAMKGDPGLPGTATISETPDQGAAAADPAMFDATPLWLEPDLRDLW
ncbi:hypothetical protein [Microtetraspora malaysiensis]|uniref:Uncharacterized protein n=1 Tax=Microtetraspora malaysiensis TaxID=161358 RepID=A0ABW6T010_9ACTN